MVSEKKKARLLQKQIDKVHNDTIREVPLPINPIATVAIAQDARELMLVNAKLQGLPPPPSRVRHSEDHDEISFFDKSITEGITNKPSKPLRPLWIVFLSSLWRAIQLEFFMVLLRTISFILYAVSIYYLSKLLQSPEDTECDYRSVIIFCIVWACLALAYNSLYSVLPWSRGLRRLSSPRKGAVALADSIGFIISMIPVLLSWGVYGTWQCHLSQGAWKITFLNGPTSLTARQCGRSYSCKDLRRTASILTSAFVIWLLAFIATLHQVWRRRGTK